MFAVISRCFSDISVRTKLFIGFGMVLTLTAAVAMTGFNAITNILERQALMTTLSDVNASFGLTRQSEKTFALNSSDQAAENLMRELSVIQSQLDQAMSQTENPAYLRQFQEMSEQSELYLGHFQDYVRARSSASAARQTMEASADKALNTFEKLKEGFFERTREILRAARLSNEDPLSLAETSSQLSGYVATLRQKEFEFIESHSREALNRWNGVFEEMRAIATELADWQEGDELEALENAISALDTYKQGFERFQQLKQASDASLVKMEQTAADVVSKAEQAYKAQQAQMTSVSETAYYTLGAMSLAAIALGIVSALINTRLILVPLRKVVSTAQRIAAGDLTEDQVVNRKDELGQLFRAMQDMTVSLRELIGRISRTVNQVAEQAEQLSNGAAETSGGVQRQKVETDHAASAVEEMATSVSEVASSARNASEAAADADVKAKDGDKIVSRVVSQIQSLKDVVEQSKNSVNKLSQESQEIGKILDVIKAVSEQTNLLALNAAIEAARAGEHGRGFSVVADEVRALASRTQNSTEEIESLIGNLQLGASTAVSEMESSSKLTGDTVSQAGEASILLSDVSKAVSTIDSLNQQIASAAEQQSVAANSISESVTLVRDIGESSAQATQKTAAASKNLAGLGNDLQQAVSRFKT